MISIEQITVNFGGFDLLKEISFVVNPKDRIGLAGRNGAGKSTLLKIISGNQQPSSGNVVAPGDTQIGYLPQHMNMQDGRSVVEEASTAFDHVIALKKKLDYLNNQLATREDYESEEYHKIIAQVSDLNDYLHTHGSDNFQAEIELTLKGLGFKREDFDRPTTEFSGGWRMRIELAKVLLGKPDVLLLDEPTNHLDIESIQWLENFLVNYAGAVILVSHDRAFLDNLTNRTIEISLGKIYDYKANYTHYLELRKERREQQLAAYRNQQKMIEDTEAFIERFRSKATKAVQVQSRIKQLEKLERIEVDEEDTRKLNIKFPPAPRSGAVLVDAKDLTKKYDDHLVLDKVDLVIERGEKVAFVGRNGEGKTTMARIIMNELEYLGDLKLGHNMKLGYFAQNQPSLLDGEISVLETVDNIAFGDIRTKIRDILGAFMFGGEDVDKKVKVLSGGERSRLAMVKLLLEPYNVLLLDEPTHHLDIHSKEILKQAMIDFDGTIIIVSHDREFLDGLVDCVYEFKDRKIKQHKGGIYNFLERKRIENMREFESQKKSNTKTQETIQEDQLKQQDIPTLSYAEQKEISKQISKAKRSLENNESEIERLETEIENMENTMSENPEKGSDSQYLDQYEEKKAKLDQVMEAWEEAQMEYEEMLAKKTW